MTGMKLIGTPEVGVKRRICGKPQQVLPSHELHKPKPAGAVQGNGNDSAAIDRQTCI